MNETGHESIAIDHAHHGGNETAVDRIRVPWRLVYVLVLVTAVVSLLFLVQDGGSSALLVLFAGLMALHHLPGGHRSGHGRARVNVQGESTRGLTPEDSARPTSNAPPHH